jgi:acetaldehyde/propanal dehydrogenase
MAASCVMRPACRLSAFIECKDMNKIRCAVLGSGNIGTDLMYKLQRSEVPASIWMIGIDSASEGLGRAEKAGLKISDQGVDALIGHVETDAQKICFDAISANAHQRHSVKLTQQGVMVIDLAPAARRVFDDVARD